MNKSKKQLAVLVSNAGTGTNLQAIIDAIENGKLNAEIMIVVSDTSDAVGLTRAKKHGITTHVLLPEEHITSLLKTTYPSDYIILAGWKKIITDEMIEAFPNKILNVHPGVIPDTTQGIVQNPDGTPGLWNRGKFTNKAIAHFLDEKATYAGSSIHFLTKQFDFGPVLGRCFEKILPEDTVETLYGRLKVRENALYVDILQTLVNS